MRFSPKAGCQCIQWEYIIRKDLKKIGTTWEKASSETLNCLGLRKTLYHMSWPQAAWWLDELLVVLIACFVLLDYILDDKNTIIFIYPRYKNQCRFYSIVFIHIDIYKNGACIIYPLPNIFLIYFPDVQS